MGAEPPKALLAWALAKPHDLMALCAGAPEYRHFATILSACAAEGSGQDTEFVVLQSGTTVRIQMLAPRNGGFSHCDSRPPTQ